MVPMKYVFIFFMCIFAPKGCVVQHFFTKEEAAPKIIVQAPYAKVYKAGEINVHVLALPLSELKVDDPNQELSEGGFHSGWLIYGKERTHLPITLLKTEKSSTQLLVKIFYKGELQEKSLSNIQLELKSE